MDTDIHPIESLFQAFYSTGAKPENVAKLSNITFLGFIPSTFSKKDDGI
jgi:hypothetical protein